MRKQTGEEQAEVHDGTMVVVFHWQNLQSDYATRVSHEHNHYSYDYSLENQPNHVVLLLAQLFFWASPNTAVPRISPPPARIHLIKDHAHAI